jgi:hypothetical protein
MSTPTHGNSVSLHFISFRFCSVGIIYSILFSLLPFILRDPGYLSRYSDEVDGRGWIPGRYQKIFFTLQRPDWLWGPLSLLSNGYRWFFPRGKSSRGMKLTTHLHLVPRSKMVELYISSPVRVHGMGLEDREGLPLTQGPFTLHLKINSVDRNSHIIICNINNYLRLSSGCSPRFASLRASYSYYCVKNNIALNFT